MGFFQVLVIMVSFLPAPIAMLILCAFAFFAVLLILKIWQFIKDKIPFL